MPPKSYVGFAPFEAAPRARAANGAQFPLKATTLQRTLAVDDVSAVQQYAAFGVSTTRNE